MADNDERLYPLNGVSLSGTTKSWAETLNNNFKEIDKRKLEFDALKEEVEEMPTASDATITIQKNGADVDTFTLDQANDKTINITLAKGDVGLGNVDNVRQYSASNEPPYPVKGVTVNGTDVVNGTTKIAAVTVPTKVSDLTNDEGYTKVEASSANGKIKIDGVDTTVYTEPADVMHDGDVPSWALEPTKPSYTATEVGAIPTTAKGVANGVASLDNNGKVPSTQLPSYVDDVSEYASQSAFPATGESGKIYIAIDTNKTYRWTGTQYVEISESLALGETSSTAFAGDKGKVAYDHATDSGKISSAVASGFYKFSATEEGHIGSTTAVATVDLTPLLDDSYLAKSNPTGTGALSLNRKANTTIGHNSVAVGSNTTASGVSSFAAGNSSTATAENAVAIGNNASATNNNAIALGNGTASGVGSFAVGGGTTASGSQSTAMGSQTEAQGNSSQAQGKGTLTKSKSQFAFGEYNAGALEGYTSASDRGTYVEMVGNGTSTSARSNARTLDWNGNEVLAGNIKLGNHTTLANNSNSDITVTLPSSAGTLATETYVDNAISAVDQKTVLSFDATGWTEGNDGYHTKTIATTKYPINCFNNNNKVVMATLGVTKSGTAVTAITIESDEPFAGYVVAL